MSTGLAQDLARLLAGRHHAPHEVLGRFERDGSALVRVHLPGARDARLEDGVPLVRRPGTDLFEGRAPVTRVPTHPVVSWRDRHGHGHRHRDPYSFPAELPEHDVRLFHEGRHRRAHRFLGAQPVTVDGVAGMRFAVWAPNAERVSVVGDFDGWDGRRHPMRSLGWSGLWCLFVPDLGPGERYKYELRGRGTDTPFLKADPFATAFEAPPATASLTPTTSSFRWTDDGWLAERGRGDPLDRPLSVYEFHPGSWQRGADGRYLSWRELAPRLADHVLTLGFTHVELLPIMEHPFDGSWGYQTLGYFAPTARFGGEDDFRFFVDHLHGRGLGVLLDWVPGHFPRDAHGLARFDGTALFEHADPRRGEHREWDTLIFNYGRNEVRSFLTSSALRWLEDFHVDGLRVDAVASMLYLDYARGEGDWVPNVHGGRENLEAVSWLQELNAVTHGECPGTLTIAEESTAWPQVTRPGWVGGLGFDLKWNLGWMHDTLEYLSHDPVHRRWHHERLTFGMLYAYSENYLLPFSHDEVVHGKGGLLAKMPGDRWQRFANLRLLYSYQFTWPGKKLLFMGAEYGEEQEWSHDRALDTALAKAEFHRGLAPLLRDLNALYRNHAAFGDDHGPDGFAWIDCHDHEQSVIAFERRRGEACAVVVLNFTPVPRHGYRIGVPRGGEWREALNSDSRHYGGSDLGNGGRVRAEAHPWMDRPASLVLTLPPLGGLVFVPA